MVGRLVELPTNGVARERAFGVSGDCITGADVVVVLVGGLKSFRDCSVKGLSVGGGGSRSGVMVVT